MRLPFYTKEPCRWSNYFYRTWLGFEIERRKVFLEKHLHPNGCVVLSLTGHRCGKWKVLNQMVLELTESVLAPYGVFSILYQLNYEGAPYTKPNKKYESEAGLADDIYNWIKRHGPGPVWIKDHAVWLWTRGCAQELMKFLDRNCRSRFSYDRYWNDHLILDGFANVPQELSNDEIWERYSPRDVWPDIRVRFIYTGRIAVQFFLRGREQNSEEAKRICRLMLDACIRHSIKPILKGFTSEDLDMYSDDDLVDSIKEVLE